ncbi:MAG: glycerophosphodiester phosphodiesterase family protein, partial [Pseudomonadota bacterium]
MTTFLDFFEGRQRPAVCGHRGHSVDGLENSFAALTAARERGADLCEIDVRLTADGEMIVFHDAVLDDTSTASGAVRDWVWSDLKTVHHKARDKGTVLEPIRLVKDILAHALVTDLRLVVELKDQMSEEALDQLAM